SGQRVHDVGLTWGLESRRDATQGVGRGRAYKPFGRSQCGLQRGYRGLSDTVQQSDGRVVSITVYFGNSLGRAVLSSGLFARAKLSACIASRQSRGWTDDHQEETVGRTPSGNPITA